MLLCPSSITVGKKAENVQRVWSWSGQTLSSDSPWLRPEVLEGVGSAGTAYNTNRWREFTFFIRLMLVLKKLPSEKRDELLGDGWKFAEWLESIPEAKSRQFRPMMLFLLFPDDFERIFGGDHRRLIIQKFSNHSKAAVRRFSPLDIDRQLNVIRKEQETALGTKEVDFYLSPLVEKWQTEEAVEEDDEKKEAEHPRPVQYWIEKTVVSGRPDRQIGDHALGKALWSPQTSVDGRNTYSTMRDVQAGDVVLHLTDNIEIKGMSIAAASADNNFRVCKERRGPIVLPIAFHCGITRNLLHLWPEKIFLVAQSIRIASSA